MDTLDEKKGEDILLLDVQNVVSFTDFFVFCSGTSDRMLDALSKFVREEVKQKFKLLSIPEGNSINGWVLLDLGDVIVHLFSPEKREYYRLEELWSEGKVLVKLQ
ncbi:MAG TPA: ribosome silencing factor [Anaerolineaceae bacterium]|nr:ribosome silencing factor [Anaerolineaceae bacterium]